jgi:glycosyltransferase involved in cell wall biosynthesis
MDGIAMNNNVLYPQLSIIIPVKDEEESIARLADEVGTVMRTTPWSWECLWIDDGSTDNTLQELQRINKSDSHHQFIVLPCNYGQSAALSVGFSHARAEILVTLDGDGQNDPAEIPTMVKQLLDHDADMVNGWRQKRKDNWIRRASSRIANSFRNWATNEQVRDVGCSLRALRRRCVQDIPVFKGMHRFLPTMVRMRGCTKIVEMPVHHRPRKYGLTKYGIHNRLWVGLMDTFAVRWMQARLVFPETKSSSLDGGSEKAI